MVWLMCIWWLAGIIIVKFNNSVSIFRKNDILFNFKGGHTVPIWRIKEVLIEYSDDSKLVKKLQRALWCMKIGSFILFLWAFTIIMFLIFN